MNKKPLAERNLEGCVMALFFGGMAIGGIAFGVVKFLAWWRIAFGG